MVKKAQSRGASSLQKKPKKALLRDERFAAVQSDPLFHEMPKKARKIKVDDRFKAMFTDKDFTVGRTDIDSRGRPIALDQRKSVRDLYEFEGDHEKESSSEAEESETEEDKVIRLDLARGAGNLYSSDDDSDSTIDSEVEPEPADAKEHGERVLRGHIYDNNDDEKFNARHVEWASKRLAVCNMDWDNVRAEDILVLLLSFKPPTGEVKGVSVYLSDFGAERIAQEEVSGPTLKVDPAKVKDCGDDELDDKVVAAVRAYQSEKMKYYYAVAECDTVETASAIYEGCDRLEFESSGVSLDLRFIPDKMEFDDERLRERISMDSFNVSKYRPNYFRSTITNLRPQLKWDENNPQRAKKIEGLLKRENLGDLSDVGDLIAGSESEAENGDSDEEARKQKLADLFVAAGINAKQKSDMDVEWDDEDGSSVGSDDDDEKLGSSEDDGSDSGASDVDENGGDVKSSAPKSKKTPFQEYLERRRAKRRERKQQVRVLKANAREASSAEAAASKLAAKANSAAVTSKTGLKEGKVGKKKSELAANLAADVTDSRFSALFTDSEFAIDKSNPNYKGGALPELQVAEKVKRKRKAAGGTGGDVTSSPPAKKESNDDLVSKLKSRAEKFKQRKRTR